MRQVTRHNAAEVHRASRSARVATIVVTLLGAVLAGTVPVSAGTPEVLADWRMNEAPGATVMVDSGPNGIDGTIGPRVRTGIEFSGGSIGYVWSRRRPNAEPAVPERLVTVDDPRLNPGTRDYAITVRFRTTRRHGNLIQKGQSTTPGGFFKLELPKGRMTCLFRSRDSDGDLNGQAFVKSPRTVFLHDGRWHTVTCEKTSDRLTMTIDGSTQVTSPRRRIGPISNTFPMTIAGKLQCDQVRVSCDYFGGDIDFIRIETG